MAAEEAPCAICGSFTKYKCTLCNEAICNRQECSVPELNDNVDGWRAGKSVAYRRDCDIRPGYLNTVDGSQEDGQEVEHPTRSFHSRVDRKIIESWELPGKPTLA